VNNIKSHNNLIRNLTLADLQGSLTKTLVVPTGYQGVALGGEGDVYSAGTHKVITLRQRLFGKASDWRFALLPATPFVLRVPIPRLQAGDGTWVDVNALLLLHVEDALRAATACPAVVTELAAGLSAALEAPVRQAVTGWAAGDLDRPEVNARLAAVVRPILEAQAQTWGLAVERLLAVTARPSAETVEEARKLAEIEAALAQVEMGKRMDALTSQAEWLDFVRNLEANYGLPAGALGEGVTGVPELKETVATYAEGAEVALEVRARRRLGAPQRPEPLPPVWWEQALPWLKLAGALALFAGLVLYALSPLLALNRAEVFLLVAVVVALYGIAFWAEQQAAIRRRMVVAPQLLLERLGKGDRQRMDRLVREQLARELAAIRTKINDARTHAYREGRREEALRLKPVEERADTLRQVAEAQGHGPAAYLTEAHITHRQLATMLDYDEELLARSAAVGDLAEAMRQTVLAAGDVAEATAQLETALSALDHQFQARARFIQG